MLANRQAFAAAILVVNIYPSHHSLSAQDRIPPPTTAPRAAVPVVPMTGSTPGLAQAPVTRPDLRVEVVLTKRQGQKVVSSRPFEMVVTAAHLSTARIRSGIELMGDKEPRFVGTSIDCMLSYSSPADPTSAMSLRLSLDDSAFVTDAARGAGPVVPQAAMLAPIRSYRAGGQFSVREKAPYVISVGSDPITGELTEATVTVTFVR